MHNYTHIMHIKVRIIFLAKKKKNVQNRNIGRKQNISYGPPNLQSISSYINSCPERVKEWGTCCHSYEPREATSCV